MASKLFSLKKKFLKLPHVIALSSWFQMTCVSLLPLVTKSCDIDLDQQCLGALSHYLKKSWHITFTIMLNIWTFLQKCLWYHLNIKMYMIIIFKIALFPETKELTVLVPREEYSWRMRSMPWLLMPWLLVSSGHQQPWHQPRRINGFLFSTWKDLNYLHYFSVEQWKLMWIHFYVSTN